MFGCSSFPMSLADRSFDSDGNCVCVCRPNARGQLLARWVLQHGLCILSWLETNMLMGTARLANVLLTTLSHNWISL